MALVLALQLLLLAGPSAGLHRLTLEEALREADARNPEVLQAALGVPVAERGVDAAAALPNPAVGVSYGPDDPRLFGTFEQKLPVFGQHWAAIGVAQAALPAAKAELAAKRLDVRVRVRRAYSELALAQAREALAKESSVLAASLSQMARAKFEAGTASEFEAEQADLARRRADQDALDARARVQAAQLALAALIDEAAPEALVASDPLWPLPRPPPEGSLRGAVGTHPDVEAQLAEREAALARAHEQRVALLPLPVATIDVQRFPDPSIPFGLRGGISFDLPLLSWNGGAIAEEEAKAAQAGAGARAKQSVLRASLEAARGRYLTAVRRARFFHEELDPAAKRVVQMAQVAYQLGRTPLSNVLQAQSDLARSRADGLDADKAAWDALADLEESSGVWF